MHQSIKSDGFMQVDILAGNNPQQVSNSSKALNATQQTCHVLWYSVKSYCLYLNAEFNQTVFQWEAVPLFTTAVFCTTPYFSRCIQVQLNRVHGSGVHKNTCQQSGTCLQQVPHVDFISAWVCMFLCLPVAWWCSMNTAAETGFLPSVYEKSNRVSCHLLALNIILNENVILSDIMSFLQHDRVN